MDRKTRQSMNRVSTYKAAETAAKRVYPLKGKNAAVVTFRQAFGCTLSQAKAYVEYICEGKQLRLTL